MREPSQTGGFSVINKTVGLNWVMYTLISTIGYFSTLNFTNELVLERTLNINGVETGTSLMFIGLILVIMVLVSVYPLAYIPLRGILIYKINRSTKFTIF